jgi:hypothetical protein
VKLVALVGLVVVGVLSVRRVDTKAETVADLEERVARLEGRRGGDSIDDLAARIRSELDRADRLTARLGALPHRSAAPPERGGRNAQAPPAAPERERPPRPRVQPPRPPFDPDAPKIVRMDRTRAEIVGRMVFRAIPGLNKDQHNAILEILTETAARSRTAALEIPEGPGRDLELTHRRERIYEDRNRMVRDLLEPDQYDRFLEVVPSARPRLPWEGQEREDRR